GGLSEGIPLAKGGLSEGISIVKAGLSELSSPPLARGAGGVELILVSGYSGIGKSCLVNEVQKPIVRQRGYFIGGKFDQFKRNIPYASVIQAFQSLVRQLLTESTASILTWKQKLLAALGTSGKVVTDVIPEVELIIGKQPEVPELGPTESQNRFNRVFKQFISVFAAKSHPLVVFLDDLQWADSASLKLIELLVTDSDSKYLLLIGAYRDNEVSPTHPLIQTIEIIQKAGVGLPERVSNIVLAPLELSHVQLLISETLKSPISEKIQLFAELLFNKTQGNPFFLTQLLRTLYQENLLAYDFPSSTWQWELGHIQAIGITDCNVVELIARNIRKLPVSAQSALKLAACIGNQFNLEVLAIVSEKFQKETALNLWDALQAGLVLPLSNDYKIPLVFEGAETALAGLQDVRVDYKFLHDRVQQAAYSLIPEEQKKETHLKIGQLLLQNTAPEARKDNIFALVNQLNFGIDLLTSEPERCELAELNLIAGQKAKAAAAFEPALRYFNLGIELLNSVFGSDEKETEVMSSWQSDYNLTLALYTEAMEAEYLNTNLQQAEILGDLILQQATTPLDAVKVYEIKIQMYINTMQMPRALDTGLEALEMMGFSLSKIQDLAGNEVILPQFEDLENLPKMTDPELIAVIKLLQSLNVAALSVKPEIGFQIVVCQVNLCIQRGYSALAALSYVWYGTLLCAVGEIEKGYHAGQLAVRLLEQFDSKPLICPVYNTFNYFIRHWKEHGKESLAQLQEALQNGLDFGSLDYVCYGVNNYCIYLFWTGGLLESLLNKQLLYVNLSEKIGNGYVAMEINVLRQLNLNLQGLATDKYRLIGEAMDEVTLLPQLEAANSAWTLFHFYLYKGILLYLLKDGAGAVANISQALEYIQSIMGFVSVAGHNFYYSLSLLAVYPSADAKQQAQYLEQVEVNQEKMQDWAVRAPMNFLHKYELVEAEKARVLGGKERAMDYYDRAIQHSREQGYIQEEALANEL
ncbi:ATP-binding protein, partial [Microcoleus sp. herbarium12]|uniref:ATP-binding protein n=1 Tax=Microcoleus sp. herbarium12 TaxID=3055437 RepID=UPI002FD4FD61